MHTTLEWMQAKDVGAVWSLACRCPWDGPVWSRLDLRFHLTTRCGNGLLAREGDQLVGFLLYRCDVGEKVVRVARLGVAPERRRQRVGTQLWRQLRQHFRGVPVRRLQALVSERDLPAQLFLRAQGMRAVRIRQHDGGAAYEFVMDRPELGAARSCVSEHSGA